MSKLHVPLIHRSALLKDIININLVTVGGSVSKCSHVLSPIPEYYNVIVGENTDSPIRISKDIFHRCLLAQLEVCNSALNARGVVIDNEVEELKRRLTK